MEESTGRLLANGSYDTYTNWSRLDSTVELVDVSWP